MKNAGSRTLLSVVIVVVGLVLTTVFLINAIHDASTFGYVKAVLVAAVTLRLLSIVQKGRTLDTGDAGTGTRRDKQIAIGLAIGLGAPLLLFGLITFFVR